MTFRFLDISENDEQEFKTQLRIAYNSHFKNTKPFDDVFTDWNIPELSIQNDLYFNDIENAKTEMYESKNNGDEPYMKDFISDLQENLSFVPTIKVIKDIEYDPAHSFTVEEMKLIKEWQKNHRIKNHPEGETYQGAVGVERFSYTLLGTSIGMIRNCFCESCREKNEEERCKKLDELRKKWDYQIDFSDW